MDTNSPNPQPGSRPIDPLQSTSGGSPVAPKKRGIGSKLKWIVLVLVLLIVGAIAVVLMNLNGIVRSTVETQATKSLDLKTTLAGANVSIFGGSLSLNDLNIASPTGYAAPQMLSLGGANVNVKLNDLRGDPVRVKSITLDRPRIVIEAKGTKFNFQTIIDNQPAPSPKTEPAGEPLRLIIDTLTINGAQVALRPGLDIPGLQQEYAVTLPEIKMLNIGSGDGAQNGAAIKEVVVQMLTVIASKAAESEQLPKELRDLLNLNVDAVAQRLGSEVNKQLVKVTKDLTKNLPPEVGGTLDKALGGQDPGKAVEQGLKDVFGGGKDKPKKGAEPATKPSK